MKKILIFVFAILIQVGCKKSEEATPDVQCSISNYAKDKTTATKRIIGVWQLEFITSMIAYPPPPPKVTLTFKSDTQVKLVVDGITKYEGKYEIKTTILGSENALNIVLSDWDYQKNINNFTKGTLYLCDTKIFIDDGIALDGPGYSYTKIGNI